MNTVRNPTKVSYIGITRCTLPLLDVDIDELARVDREVWRRIEPENHRLDGHVHPLLPLVGLLELRRDVSRHANEYQWRARAGLAG